MNFHTNHRTSAMNPSVIALCLVSRQNTICTTGQTEFSRQNAICTTGQTEFSRQNAICTTGQTEFSRQNAICTTGQTEFSRQNLNKPNQFDHFFTMLTK